MKQETTSEAFFRISKELDYSEFDFISFKIGIEWQQEQGKNEYSEEDLDMLRKFMIQEQNFSKSCLDVFIEQFKKKIRYEKRFY
jgi:hypothetical protein